MAVEDKSNEGKTEVMGVIDDTIAQLRNKRYSFVANSREGLSNIVKCLVEHEVYKRIAEVKSVASSEVYGLLRNLGCLDYYNRKSDEFSYFLVDKYGSELPQYRPENDFDYCDGDWTDYCSY